MINIVLAMSISEEKKRLIVPSKHTFRNCRVALNISFDNKTKTVVAFSCENKLGSLFLLLRPPSSVSVIAASTCRPVATRFFDLRWERLNSEGYAYHP